MKILFFHIPSLSMYNLLEPVLVQLQERGHQVTHYNERSFARYLEKSVIKFVPYGKYRGYFPSACTNQMGLYNLGLLLLETAEEITSAVEEAVLYEKPDLILHSKFVAAAKLIAAKYEIPAVCMTTGFVFHPSTIIEEERKRTAAVDMSNVSSLLQFRKRARKFYGGCQSGTIDVDDIFVNSEELNLLFGFEEFQPPGPNLEARWHLLGPPAVNLKAYAKSYEVIYASLGSVFVDNKPFYQLCIDAFGSIGHPAVVSLGGRFAPEDFENVPENVQLCPFVRQREVLQSAAVFVTQGGDASIAEAIHCETPMVVVPQIAEQLFNAQQIERLNLGSCIRPRDLTRESLSRSVAAVLDNPAFRTNVQAMKKRLPKVASDIRACDLIEQFVFDVSRNKATAQ